MPRGHLMVAATVMVLFIFAEAQGQKIKATTTPRLLPTGIVTDRLDDKDLEKWKTIERIVFAEDNENQPLHPTLRNLWQWVETSGHTVYIEIVNFRNSATCTAGLFTIEKFDPLGERHTAVIKLNLTNINLAYVGPETRRPNGFIPFLWLEKDERYAEVLGHELAHAVHILTSLERTQRVEEEIQKTNQQLLTQHRRNASGGLAPDLKHRLTKRDVLLKELEDQAEEMERIVWEELVARKPEREKTPVQFDK